MIFGGMSCKGIDGGACGSLHKQDCQRSIPAVASRNGLKKWPRPSCKGRKILTRQLMLV